MEFLQRLLRDEKGFSAVEATMMLGIFGGFALIVGSIVSENGFELADAIAALAGH